MHSFPWQRKSRFLLAIFFVLAVCSFPRGISLQWRRFVANHPNNRNLGSSGTSTICYGFLPEKANIDDECFNNSFKIEGVDRSTSWGRRNLLLSTSSLLGLTGIYGTDPAQAVRISTKRGLYLLENTKETLSEASLLDEQVQVFPKLGSEVALLKVLPIKNTIFRTVEQNLESLSVLRYRRGTSNENIDKAWARADQSVDTALTIIMNKRNQLEPVFNPDDSAEMAKLKTERGEKLLGDLSQDLFILKEAIARRNITCAFQRQRSGLITLGFLGELLVKRYPYKVPYKGKYSYLPRLLGRAQVTFRFKRGGNVLGNVKIVADGYIAPITAGNFVDLCLRNFYTGLPIKAPTKKSGLLNQELHDNLPMNIFGSYNEGFYDPLTGQLRQIPLEVILLEGSQKLSYSYSRQYAEPDFEAGEAKFVPETTSKPLLTFETPGLVAMNHPVGKPNGGSSEFFSLQSSATKNGSFKRGMLDGQYAPFGYIIEGFDIFDSLQPGDIIDSTSVDSFGQLNLVKIRSSTFKEVAKGTEEASAKAKLHSSTPTEQ